MKNLMTRQAVIGQLIALCDLDLGLTKRAFVHCPALYGNAHAYQVSNHSALRWQRYALDKSSMHFK